MQISHVVETEAMPKLIQVLINQEVDKKFSLQCVLLFGSLNFVLSTTEAEYIAMSMALRDVIPDMKLFDEMRGRNFLVLYIHPIVYCTVCEDISGAPELACLPKLCPQTKHINICYHHFREHV
ncbi:hypothetical protein ACHAW6_002308 [Cyclotella cf. meneghiniana]